MQIGENWENFPLEIDDTYCIVNWYRLRQFCILLKCSISLIRLPARAAEDSLRKARPKKKNDKSGICRRWIKKKKEKNELSRSSYIKVEIPVNLEKWLTLCSTKNFAEQAKYLLIYITSSREREGCVEQRINFFFFLISSRNDEH